MRVKKFEAKSMKEALQMVKKELGPDAVILAARDNRKSFGLGGQASVEITAAVSETTLKKKHFVESRMTTTARERFAQSDAKTQRQIIERMVENRLREREEKAQAQVQGQRQITQTSYIDIPDDIEPNSRRSAAFERAAGRNVGDLLNDFDQDFSAEDDQWEQRPAREVLRDAQRGGQQPSERALDRIRNAASRLASAAPQQVRSQGTAPARGSGRNESTSSVGHDMDIVPDAFGKQNPRNPAQKDAQREPQTRNQAQGHAQQAQASSPVSQAAVPAPVQGTGPTNDTEIANLKNEISRLQQMLEGFQKVPQTFVTMHPGAEFGISYDLSFMYQKLVEAGITIDNTVDILQQAARELDPIAIKKRPIVDAWVARWLLTNIHVSATPWQGRIHLFVGGAGSGKTSTLVKMASHLVVKEKKKVAILSTDSFKVGAVDQLKIYCQILNVPFAVIRNRKDWEWVLGQLNTVDHILVDFPGLQLRDLDEIHLLKSLLPPEGLAPVTHFCVSATAKDGDAYEIARRYKVTDFADLIVTNLDQSVQHGIIHNLQKKAAKPLHSFGIGNRIPEDYEAASKERVLDLIFKLTKLRKDK